jgi:tight adherence protein B
MMKTFILIATAALLVAAPASAADSLRIGKVDASAYPTVRVSVVTPTPSPTAPALSENGRSVTGLDAANLAQAKSVVVLIDNSRSMEGAALKRAVEAARKFVASKPAGDRVSLIAFGHVAVRMTGFSNSTTEADSALWSLNVDTRQGTALYDAIALGAKALTGEPQAGRVIVVLTDGDDVSSKTTLAKAAAEAKHAGVSVYAIGIEGSGFSPGALTQVATSTGGAYFPAASSSGLEAAYRSVAERLRRTWRLTYTTSGLPGDTVLLRASLAGVTPATVKSRLPGKTGVVSEPSRSWFGDFLIDSNIAAFFLALFTGAAVLLAVGLALATPSGVRLRKRLDPHLGSPRKGPRGPVQRDRFSAASGMFAATEKSLAHLRLWKYLERLIERADLPLRTVELFYICIGSGVGLGLLFGAFRGSMVLTVAGLAIGGVAPVFWVSFKARQRMAAIEEQLPDLLITIAASLKAGHSFRQGLQAVVDEGQPPTSDEFKRVLTETSLGRPMDDALNEMTVRVGSKNLDFVITAVAIQRQVGGSLAGIFDMVADAVRQRQQFARKIKSLTAMGRASAYVLVGLPFFMAFILTLMNPEYMSPLYNTSTGHKLIATSIVAMVFGIVLLRKIVSFRG